MSLAILISTAEAGQSALEQKKTANVAGGIERKSTRAWAMETGYDAKKIFNKVGFVNEAR